MNRCDMNMLIVLGLFIILIMSHAIYDHVYKCFGYEPFDIIYDHRNLSIVDLTKSENGVPISEIIIDLNPKL